MYWKLWNSIDPSVLIYSECELPLTIPPCCSGQVRHCLGGGGGIPMETNARLLLTNPARIHARDQKLLLREERLADEQRLQTRKCKCRICIGSVRSRRRRHIVRKHLQEIGRHPYHRGKTPVSEPKKLSIVFGFNVDSRCFHRPGTSVIFLSTCTSGWRLSMR